MRTVRAILLRELTGYFATPLAYVFIVLFLVLIGWLTFEVGGLLARDQADLQAFFPFYPWVFLLLVPAISMRLWAEERRQGTMELLMTLPVAPWQAVLGKFLAAWVFMAVALALTGPIWATIAYLGDPDHGAIATGYLGSLLLAGAYLAIGAAVSAATANQVIAFVGTAAVCFAMTATGLPLATSFVADWAPRGLVDAVSAFSFLTRYEGMMRGVVSLPDVVFFLSTMALALYVNILIVTGRPGA